MERSSRADSVSAWAVGIGAGLIGLQLTWLVANPSASIVWESPTGPTVAFLTAVVVGFSTAVLVGHRLAGTPSASDS